ncbi:hypothetical protein Anas_00069 [Armadillidium nasatum]|uniref:Uncharacterized protein n=1 Tax=Armadillidium nasatum TaxID=96803 RepID=A0A5N5TL62_9CRUS|nr:hypothetical protein Anas_00069 [Armadillidium nasatum]
MNVKENIKVTHMPLHFKEEDIENSQQFEQTSGVDESQDTRFKKIALLHFFTLLNKIFVFNMGSIETFLNSYYGKYMGSIETFFLIVLGIAIIITI